MEYIEMKCYNVYPCLSGFIYVTVKNTNKHLWCCYNWFKSLLNVHNLYLFVVDHCPLQANFALSFSLQENMILY